MGGSAEPSRQTALKTAVKETLNAAGHMTWRARMLPSFIVIGGQRCGTTTVHLALRSHPRVVLHRLHKGVNYFDVNYDKGMDWYRAHFPVQAYANARSRRSGGAAVTGESSGYYMFHPLAAERIAADLPGVKLIALVRDPVERAYSAHQHEHRRGYETEPFERAIELEPERLAGEEDRLRNDPAYESYSHRHHAYVGRGRYAAQLRRFVEHCGRDNVLVLDANDFFADPVDGYRRVLSFLELPPQHNAPLEKSNAQPRAPMSDALRRRLRAEFDDDDAQLVEFLGATPSWRR